MAKLDELDIDAMMAEEGIELPPEFDIDSAMAEEGLEPAPIGPLPGIPRVGESEPEIPLEQAYAPPERPENIPASEREGGFIETMLPRTTEPQNQKPTPIYDRESGQVTGYIMTSEGTPFAPIEDIGSGAVRGAGALLDPVLPGDQAEGENIAERFRDPESGVLKPVKEHLLKQLQRPEAGIIAKAIDLTGLLGVSVIEDPLSFINLGMSKVPGFAKKIDQILSATGRTQNKLVGKLSEEVSGVSEEALRMASTKQGRSALEASADKQYEIGQELLDRLDKLGKGMPEQEKVNEVLKNLGNITVEDARTALQAQKAKPIKGILLPHEQAANNKIDTFIETLKPDIIEGETVKNFQKLGGKEKLPDFKVEKSLRAGEFKDLRSKFDVNIDFTKEEAGLVNNALKKTRTVMKDQLIEKAKESGNPDYIKWMESWSDKLNKLERVNKMLGGNAAQRQARVEQFIGTLFGKNKTYKRQLMSDLDDIYGGVILEKAKAASLAGEFGKGGKAGILPRQFTGRALLGIVIAPTGLSIPFTSPYIVSRITLPVAKKLESAFVKSGGAVSKNTHRYLAQIIKANKPVIKMRLADKLIRELDKQSDD